MNMIRKSTHANNLALKVIANATHVVVQFVIHRWVKEMNSVFCGEDDVDVIFYKREAHAFGF